MIKYIKKVCTVLLAFGFKIMYRLFPVRSKTVLYIAFHGRGYLDNPMALHQYMLKEPRFSDYQFIWVLKKPDELPTGLPRTKAVKYLSLPYFIALASSKYWISNCKLPNYILKKPTQIYLQTWHGTPLKRLAHDIIVPKGTTFYRSGLTETQMHQTYDVDVKKYTYMISPSQFTTTVFQSAFQIEKERLIETGYPRNDKLMTTSSKEVQKIKAAMNLPIDKKVILYAPTWRDNSFVTKGYTFQLEVHFDLWKEILGEEYIVLFKPHYLIVNTFSMEKYQGFVYPMKATMDIADLYVISDVLITDYSSVFFDYAILKRPIYFYMYDLDNYQSELRGFYIDIYKDLPGQVWQEEKQMLEAIKTNQYDYQRLETFNQHFNNMEDGHASKRVVDIVFKEEWQDED